ncbi:ATP-binding protein [Pseudomonas sp. K1(2024)]|uniref:histidine kinase n=1 Tax=Pseudomonas boreofloridensis TaxID=3064348 RepID=A0ABV4ZDI7_9PSED|nr:ATP-binding protein [Pseudomonas sp. K13]MDO7904270.1 PAS domain-containing protein [Pseudomonas sp. K13]
MSGAFERWLGGGQPLAGASVPAVGLQFWLDEQGDVQHLGGPLRAQLSPVAQRAVRVQDALLPHSAVVLEGAPQDWQGQPLDLDFPTVQGSPLRTRGWLQRQGAGWLLQLFDIGDLLGAQQHQAVRDDVQRLAVEIGRAVRECTGERLLPVIAQQLQRLAEHWQARAVQVWCHEQGDWHSHAVSDHHWPWAAQAQVRPWLHVLAQQGDLDDRALAELQVLCGGLPLRVLPYREGGQVQACLLCVAAEAPFAQAASEALVQALLDPFLARWRQQHMQRSTDHLHDLQRQLGAGGWHWSPDGLLELEAALAERLGLPCAVSIEHWLEQLHPADREAARLALQQVREGQALSLDLRLSQADAQGDTRWLHWVGALHGGQVRGVVLDISALKAQEQQAGAARARLENLIASSPAVIYVQRYDEGALHSAFFSASLEPLLGWRSDGEQVRQPGLAVHPHDREQWLERTRTLLREGQVRCRYRLRDQLGGYHWILDEARLLRDDLGQPLEVVGLWLDVSDATEAAERVRQSEERYRVLVDDSPAMICRYRPDLQVLFGNRPLADYLECAPDQLAGMNLGRWLSDGDREAFVQRLASLTPEQPLSSTEICLQLPGREQAWWVWADRGLFDAQGRLLEVQAVGRDNTEVRRSQRQLLQGAKMATLGELATGLVHEINQPLNVMRMAVTNSLKRLHSGTADVPYLSEKLQRIETQVERTVRLVEHMRVYGRRSELERQAFVAWRAVDGALALLGEGLRGKGVKVQAESPASALQVLGHPDQLEQVLINLMVNARDALLERRTPAPCIRLAQQRVDGCVCLLVEDNAGGIDPRLLGRIFEPFFTTKPAGVGTGLGLSVSHGIIEAMGGTLEVANAEHGACFRVVLPLYSTS